MSPKVSGPASRLPRAGRLARAAHRIASSKVGRFIKDSYELSNPGGPARLALAFGSVAGGVGCFGAALSLLFGAELAPAASIGISAGSIALSTEAAILNIVSLDTSAQLDGDIQALREKIARVNELRQANEAATRF